MLSYLKDIHWLCPKFHNSKAYMASKNYYKVSYEVSDEVDNNLLALYIT